MTRQHYKEKPYPLGKHACIIQANHKKTVSVPQGNLYTQQAIKNVMRFSETHEQHL